MGEKRQVYDFTKSTDVARFEKDHVKKNEGDWYALVAYMEANHDKISLENVRKYKKLIKNQSLLDSIMKKLRR